MEPFCVTESRLRTGFQLCPQHVHTTCNIPGKEGSGTLNALQPRVPVPIQPSQTPLAPVAASP